MKLRCSELDRVMACTASAHPQPGEVIIDHEAGEAARIGTAVHAVMADVVRERWHTVPDVRPYCEDAGCAAKETDVRILSYAGMKFLREYRKFLSETPLVETELETGFLVGHPDIVDYVEDDGERIVYVIDWKTGEKDEDSRYRAQLLGYAVLGGTHFGQRKPTKVVVSIAWLRSQEVTTRSYTLEDCIKFSEHLFRIVLDEETVEYTPGESCRYCPRIAACPGRRDLMLAAVEVLTSERRGSLIPYNGQLVDPQGFARSIQQARFLRDLCETHLRQAEEAVKAMGVSDIPTPSGQRITLVSRAGRPMLKPERVLPYLRERFGAISEDELAGMVTLSKGCVESFVASKADTGEKKTLKETVFTELEQTGAMTRGAAVEYLEVKEA